MLRLDATTRKLQVVLAGAVTTNQLPVVVSYSDKTTLDYTGATQVANTNGVTAVDICDAPAASTIRDIDYVSVRNGDTASATVTIRFNDNATLYTIATATLAVGDHLTYVHGTGWTVFDSSGALKSANTTAAISVTNTPAGGIAATNVQSALNELDTEKAPLAGPTFTGTVTSLGAFVLGDVGTESAGVDMNGTIQDASLYISEISATPAYMALLHKHNTSTEPRMAFARSNSNTSGHATVSAAMTLCSIHALGYTGSHYDRFGSMRFAVGTGTVSATSSPGKWVLALTPDGSNTVADVITANSNKSVVFAGDILPTDGVSDLGAAASKFKRIYADYTNTATVGAVTINKMSGRVNIAAAGTAVTVTNSLVTAASHVFAVASTNDATAQVTSVVPAAGSFVINTVACTAQTSFDFFVINAD